MHIYIYAYIHVYVLTYLRICAYVHTYIHTYVHVCIRTYAANYLAIRTLNFRRSRVRALLDDLLKRMLILKQYPYHCSLSASLPSHLL